MMTQAPTDILSRRQQAGIDPDRFPRSVAIIMDGNGRWARQRGLPRVLGHQAGAKVVRKIASEAARLGVECLTLYSFSLDNWKRPPDEVAALMGLYAQYLALERTTLMENNLVLQHLGRRDGLPQDVPNELDQSVRMTADNTGMTLCLALNYGSRAEITEAVRTLAERAAAGRLRPEQINEQMIADTLDTAGLPDPDLLIRTAGERRLSNYLLWQVSYAEFYISDVFWPDFDEAEFHKALRAFADRHRRFGALEDLDA